MRIVVGYCVNKNLCLKQTDKIKPVPDKGCSVEYSYTDRTGQPDHVQILISAKANMMDATIDFRDIEQYKSFLLPDWLIPL